jgi:hypothetical protein
MSDFPGYDVANLGTRLASVTEADVNVNGLALELFRIWNTPIALCPASLRLGGDGVPTVQPQPFSLKGGWSWLQAVDRFGLTGKTGIRAK